VNALTPHALLDELFRDFAFLDLMPAPRSVTLVDERCSLVFGILLPRARAGEKLNDHYSPKHVRGLYAQAANFGIDLCSVAAAAVAEEPVGGSLADRWVTNVPDDVKAIPGFREQFG
jgi:hypothetical protein